MKAMGKMKQNVKRAFFLGVLLACSFFLLGWADDLESLKEKVKFVNSIQSEFTQEKHLKILNAPLVSKGLLYFESPRSLRWEYTGPVKNVVLMENNNIRQFVQAGSAMVEQRSQELEAMRVFLQEICLWIQGEFKINPDLEAEMTSDRRILLKPAKDKPMAQVIQRIELKLTDIPGVIESVKIYEDQDSYTDIRFHNTKINQSINKDVFQKLNPAEIEQ